MNPKLFYTVLLSFSILISCNHSAKQEVSLDTTLAQLPLNESQGQDDKNELLQLPAGDSKKLKRDTGSLQIQQQPFTYIDWNKKIIKTATVNLEVKDFKKYNESIHTTIRQFGGYIAQEEQNFTGQKSETILSIKVPVQQFEVMMNELSASDVKVIDRKIASQDVTGEVIDTKSRLEAKRQVRLKYLDFLKESKNMEDVLKVQNEINGIQEDIEAAAGRVDYLSHQAAYSTINLTFYQPVNGYQPETTDPTFLTRVSKAFKVGAEWIADLLIALLSVWPLILIITGCILIFKAKISLKVNSQKS